MKTHIKQSISSMQVIIIKQSLQVSLRAMKKPIVKVFLADSLIPEGLMARHMDSQTSILTQTHVIKKKKREKEKKRRKLTC